MFVPAKAGTHASTAVAAGAVGPPTPAIAAITSNISPARVGLDFALGQE